MTLCSEMFWMFGLWKNVMYYERKHIEERNIFVWLYFEGMNREWDCFVKILMIMRKVYWGMWYMFGYKFENKSKMRLFWESITPKKKKKTKTYKNLPSMIKDATSTRSIVYTLQNCCSSCGWCQIWRSEAI